MISPRGREVMSQNKKYTSIYETDIGKISLVSNGTFIERLDFGEVEGEYLSCPLNDKVALDLENYFKGKLKRFEVPLSPIGTAFQLQVWKALESIPYGETISYKQLAELIGNPKACRAVGMANNRNPIAIMIPCHRVIGADGKLVGYGGGLSIKQYLLELEQRNK